MTRSTPSFASLDPASRRASRAARGASRKSDTRPELILRQALWSLGLRYRIGVRYLPGKPDIVFIGAKVAVFVDGDFWHGRDLESRIAKLEQGHNAAYWVAKVRSHVQRDREKDALLREAGWLVLRYWSTDVEVRSDAIASTIARIVHDRRPQQAVLSGVG